MLMSLRWPAKSHRELLLWHEFPHVYFILEVLDQKICKILCLCIVRLYSPTSVITRNAQYSHHSNTTNGPSARQCLADGSLRLNADVTLLCFDVNVYT